MGALLSLVLAMPVWAAPALTVVPSAAGIVTVAVAGGPGNSTDWVGLYTVGMSDTAPIKWAYLNGYTSAPVVGLTTATVTLPLPTAAGAYEVRFFASDGYSKLATVAVPAGTTPLPPPVIPPPVVPPVILPPPPPPPPVASTAKLASQSVMVTITGGPGGALDWMGLFPVGALDTAYIDWARLNGTKTAPVTGVTTGKATFAIPLTGGPWEIRLLTSDGAGKYTRVAVISRIEVMP